MKSRTYLLLALFLAACASTPERYDYDGRPARMPTPTFNPAEDAPHQVGQPGHIDPDRKTLPRSPNRRVLQPTKDGRGGIYNADSNDEQPAVKLAHLMQPVPETPDGITEGAWTRCWVDVQQCLLNDSRARAVSQVEFNCHRWLIVTACGGIYADRGQYGLGGVREAYGTGPYSVDAFYQTTQRAKDKACLQVARTDAFHRLYQDLYRRCSASWRDALPRPE